MYQHRLHVIVCGKNWSKKYGSHCRLLHSECSVWYIDTNILLIPFFLFWNVYTYQLSYTVSQCKRCLSGGNVPVPKPWTCHAFWRCWQLLSHSGNFLHSWNPEVCCHFHKCPPWNPLLNQMNPAYTVMSPLSKTHFNISHLHLDLAM
jgi:hypothetical protein